MIASGLNAKLNSGEMTCLLGPNGAGKSTLLRTLAAFQPALSGQVEVMGRNAGFLALYVGISVGATAVLVPEKPVDFQKDVVERIQDSRLAGNTHFMIVVAEGAGSAVDIGRKINESLGMEPRVTVLGHIQRGGSPNARDRETATRMGYYAVRAFAEGRGNCIIGTKEGSIVEIPIEEALAMKKSLQMDRYKIMEAMQVGRADL